MTSKKSRIKETLYHFLVENGPMTTAQLMYEMKSPLGSSNQLSQVLRTCYLFERVDIVMSGVAGGRRYETILWGALPLDVATRRFFGAPKHQIQPLSKQPVFVREYVEAIQNEVDE